MGSVLIIGIFESEVYFDDRPIEMVKVAFIAGSSKQGNADRAAVGSNCVTPSHLNKLMLDQVCIHKHNLFSLTS